jgi:hypothetical protein
MGVRNDVVVFVVDATSSSFVVDTTVVLVFVFESGDRFGKDDVNGFDVFNIERYNRRISNGLSTFCAAAAVAVVVEDAMTFRSMRILYTYFLAVLTLALLLDHMYDEDM